MSLTFLLHPRKFVSIISFALLTSSASEIVVYLSSYTVLHRKSTFSENILFGSLQELKTILGNDRSSNQIDTRVL